MGIICREKWRQLKRYGEHGKIDREKNTAKEPAFHSRENAIHAVPIGISPPILTHSGKGAVVVFVLSRKNKTALPVGSVALRHTIDFRQEMPKPDIPVLTDTFVYFEASPALSVGATPDNLHLSMFRGQSGTVCFTTKALCLCG